MYNNIAEDTLLMMRHAVGMKPEAQKKHWGLRNRYAVGSGDTERRLVWDKLVEHGFAECSTQNKSQSNVIMYHLTKLGCKAVGLHKAAVDRAISP